MPRIDEKDWALVTGVCMLLQPFHKVTAILSGEKYPTFIYALPFLYSIHTYLSNDDLLNVNATMFEAYGDDPNFQEVKGDLNILQKLLLREFRSRFSSLTNDIMWTTILDPRCRQLNHLSSIQKFSSKQMLIDNVFQESLLEIQQSGIDQSPVEDPTVQQTSEANDAELFEMNFLSDVLDVQSNENTNEDSSQHSMLLLKKSVEVEVENYLNPSLYIPSSIDALSWWSVNHVNFPKIAKVARKWLCVSATSTASERVFQIAGWL